MERDRRLKIWLIKEGEENPMGSGRLHRSGMLAKYLSEQGHSVTWWSSTYIHGEKRFYCDNYREIDLNEREKLILLHSNTVYSKNVSIKRIIYHQKLARAFRQHCEEKEQPDIILCCWPTTQFAKQAVRYGKRHGVPVVIDIRDLWPDTFADVFPKGLQPLAKLALLPWELSAKSTLKAAAAIVGVMPIAVRFGCRKAGRTPGELDRHIFIGCDRTDLEPAVLEENLEWWKRLDVRTDTWNICFFSSLGQHQDLETVIHAVKRLSQRYPDIRLVIGGKGDREEKLKAAADGHASVVFAGWLGKDQMNSAMSISKCGMFCYKNEAGFQDAFGNKAVQYLAGGLPIVTPLTGFATQFIREHDVGEIYTEGDIDSCAQAIERLYLDEPRRQKMAAAALEQFEKTFEFPIVNKRFEDELYDVLNNWEQTGRQSGAGDLT